MLARHARSVGPAPELVLLLAGVWFTVSIASTLAGALLRPPPSARVDGAPGRPAALLQAAAGDRLNHLIGLDEPPQRLDDPRPAPASSCDDPGSLPVKSASGLALVAGVLADPPERSLASLADAATQETQLFAVGERRANVRLLEIVPVRRPGEVARNARELVAVICRDGRKEYVEAASGGPPPPAFPPAPAAPAALPPARAVGPDRFELQRSALDAVLANPVVYLGDARAVPAFRDGVANGFKIFAIRPGSLLSTLGVENGDVIRMVDGYEVTSLERALELYQRLRGTSRVTLDLERGGRTIRREYSIADR